MLNKKFMMLALLLVSLLAISTVSASEISDDSPLGVNDGEIIENISEGTFTDLANEIANANGELNLTRNYVFSDGDDGYKLGINISDKISINGNGFVIDGRNQSHAFNINANGVYLNSINFVGCYKGDDDLYGSIDWGGSNGVLFNCSFVGNSGPAVDWYSGDGVLVNCSFVNNSGLALYLYKGSIVNCSFANNSGGAVGGYSYSVVNCSFVNNSYRYSGGAVSAAICSIVNSSFVNNSAINYGGAVRFYGSSFNQYNCSISNSVFIDNKAGSNSLYCYDDGALTFTFVGNENYFNAVYAESCCNLKFDNVTYYNGAIVNSDDVLPVKSQNEAGINITVEIFDYYGNLVDNVTLMSDIDGEAIYDYSHFNDGHYTYRAYHADDSYYAYIEKSGDFIIGSGDFGILQNLINQSSPNAVITLERNYTFSKGGLDDFLTDGIVIDVCNLTIDGNGYTIDGIGKARIFNINSQNVTLTNINFVNGYALARAGAVNGDCSIVNCSFTNNSAGSGGAIYGKYYVGNSSIGNGLVVNCSFVNNSARYDAAAIFGRYTVVNCSFADNRANEGGAVRGARIVVNCSFVNNYVTYGGGAIHSSSAVNCSFVNNHADEIGGAVFWYDEDSYFLSGCSFVNNSAGSGGAIYCEVKNCAVSNSSFIENKADSFYLGISDSNAMLTFTFRGYENYINAIYSVKSIAFENVTYYNGDIVNSDAVRPANSENEAGINITVEIFDSEGYLIDNVTLMTGTKGSAVYDYINLDEGSYTYKAYHADDSYYTYIEKSGSFTADKVNSTISVDYLALFDELIATLIGQYGAKLGNEDITLNLNGVNYALRTDSNGKAIFSTENLPAGNYTALFSFSGNGRYYSSNTSFDLALKIHTSVSAVYTPGELVFTLTNDEASQPVRGAYLKINVNGNVSTVKTDSKGQVIVSTADYEFGNYTASATYSGNSKYIPTFTSIDFVVGMVDTNISAVYDSDSNALIVSLEDSYGNPVVGADVALMLDDESYDLVTDGDGLAVFLTGGLVPGNYTADVSYAGDGLYNHSSASVDFAVAKMNSILSVVYDCVSNALIVSLEDSYGNPVVGADVALVVDDESYDLVTDGDGLAELSTAGWVPGNYTADVSYEGDSFYNPSSASVDFSVEKADTSLFVVYDSIGHELTVVLTCQGNPISDADIEVILDDESYDLVTDLKGQAMLSTADLAQGTYDVAVSYAGDEMYNPSGSSAQIVVKINTGLTAVYDDENSEVVVSLINDATSQPIRSANVKVSLDGVQTTVKTDSNGQVKVSTSGLEAGTHFVVASYGGNSRYNPSSLNATFVIPESVDTSLSLAYDAGAGELVATLTNDLTGNPIAGEDIIFVVDDLDYAVKTDDMGQARLSTGDLAQGTYNVTASFEGDGKYSPSSASEVITVKLNTRIFVDDVTAEYGSDVELVASLIKDASGNPIKSANVRFTVNGKTYTVKTDANGQAKLTLSGLNPGTYEVNVSYYGNSFYSPSNATANVVVNKIVTASSLYYDSDAGELVAIVINTATGKGISGANVVFNLDGKKTSVKTDKQGQSRLSIGDADPNSFSAGISYAGNSKYLKSTSSIKIVEGKVPTVLSNSYDMAAGEVVATLTNFETGNAISGATVVFNVNGVKTSFKTNKTGQVKISLADFGLGELSVGSSYGGNSKYAGSGAGINIVKN